MSFDNMPWNDPWTEIMKVLVLSSFQSLKGKKCIFFLQRVAGRGENLPDGLLNSWEIVCTQNKNDGPC